MSVTERTRIEIATGHPLPSYIRDSPGLTCPLLFDGLCSVYNVRPMVCRLYGAAEHPAMSCKHGCEPERRLSDVEMLMFLVDSYDIGGAPSNVLDTAALRAAVSEPELAPLLASLIAKDYSVLPQVDRIMKRYRRQGAPPEVE